jgi:hypothetical protein
VDAVTFVSVGTKHLTVSVYVLLARLGDGEILRCIVIVSN